MGGGEPAESADAVSGEGEQGGEDAAGEGEPLQATGVAVDGEVAGEFGGPGPGEEGGGCGGDAADEGEGAGCGDWQWEQASWGDGGGGRVGDFGGFDVGHVITPCPRRVRRAGLVA